MSVQATVNADLLRLIFNEPLDPVAIPTADLFSVSVGGAPRELSDITVVGSEARLTLESPVTESDLVTVAYDPEGASTLLARDPTTAEDPLPIWGAVSAQRQDEQQIQTTTGNGGLAALEEGRVEFFESGGPDDRPFRRLRVVDGDDIFDERCQLGMNHWQNTPYAVFNEGDVCQIRYWLRLPGDFPMTSDWQQVDQIKQSQPASGAGGVPVLSFEAHGSTFSLWNTPNGGSHTKIWDTPVVLNQWLEVIWDIEFAREDGSVRLRVGEADSGAIVCDTLKQETSSGGAVPQFDSIPSLEFLGVYHASGTGTAYMDFCDHRVYEMP